MKYAFQKLSTLSGNVVGNVPKNPVLFILNNIVRLQIEEKKPAHNVSQRLTNNEKWFGRLGEHVHEYVNNYAEVFLHFILSEEEKLRFLQNLFDREPKHFYRDRIASTCSTYDDAKQLFIS